ncbi:hypothetical protein QAD02_000164, partial [Eretmocerus hayati]
DAVTLSNVEILELLLKHGANPNCKGNLLQVVTAKSNRIPMLRAFLEHGADPNNSDAIQSLLRDNDIQGIHLFLEYGCDPSRYHLFPVIFPDSSSSPDVIQEDDNSTVTSSRARNDTRVLSLILDHFKSKGTLSQALKPNRSDSNWTLLHYAARAGKFEHMKLLLQAGADPNIITLDDFGTTPLQLALCRSGKIVKGTEQCVKLLVEAGVNPQYPIVKLIEMIFSDIQHSLKYNEPNKLAECDSGDAHSEVCKYFPSEIQWRRLGKTRYTWIHHSLKKALTAIKYRLLLESKTAIEDPMPENFTKSIELQRYYKDCKTEIDFMRNYKFDGAITYHDVLTDEDFYKRMESSKALEQFSRPLIHDDILATINIYAADLEECWSQAQ